MSIAKELSERLSPSGTELDVSNSSQPGEVLKAAFTSQQGELVKSLKAEFNKLITNDDLLNIPLSNSLRVLVLNGCHQLSDPGMEVIATRCSQLEVFEIYWNLRVSDKAVSDVLSASGSNLKKVNLSGCSQLSDSVVKTITTRCVNVTDLDLTRATSMSDLVMVLISERLPHLTRLILYACHHWTSGQFAHMKRLTSLQEIDLTGTKPSEAELISIFESCVSLKHVNLTWVSEVSDRVLEVIAANCGKLEWLSLHGNTSVTDTGLQALSRSGCYSNLVALDVQGCVGITTYRDNGMSELKKAFPNVTQFILHT